MPYAKAPSPNARRRSRLVRWGVTGMMACGSLVLSWQGQAQVEPDPVRMEGTVVEVSRFPDPKTNPYKDCLFTAKVTPPRGEMGNPVILSLHAFRDRILTPESSLRPGDRIRVRALPFHRMPESYQGLQCVDDLAELELDMYAALACEKIDGFAAEASAWPRAESPGGGLLIPAHVSDAARRERSRHIRADLERIEAIRASFESWEDWYMRLAPLRETLDEAAGNAEDGYLVDEPYLFDPVPNALGYRLLDSDSAYQVTLEGFENLKAQFTEAGTDLVVVPVPMRDQLYAWYFLDSRPADGVLQPYWLKFQYDLLKRDIEVLDLVPRFRAALGDKRIVYHARIRDGHVGSDGAIEAAAAIAERLERYEFAENRREYITQPYLYWNREGLLYYGEHEPLPGVRVLEPDGRFARPDSSSEVLLIGDSALTAPLGAQSATLGIHVSKELGMPLTFFKRAGNAPIMANHLARVESSSFFSRRKVCVFVFAFEYVAFPQLQWSRVPFLHYLRMKDATQRGQEEMVKAARYMALVGAAELEALQCDPAWVTDPFSNLLLLPPTNSARRIQFPESIARAGQEVVIGLELEAEADTELELIIEGEPARSLAAIRGPSRVVFTVPGRGGPGWTGLQVPPDAPEIRLRRLDAGWVNLHTAQVDGPETLLVARYNSEEDFRLVRVDPSSEGAGGDTLRLGPSDQAQTLAIPSRPGGSGPMPRWISMRVAAEAPAPFTLVCNRVDVLEGVLPDRDAYIVAALPKTDQIEIRLPAGSPGIEIQSIELRAPANP